MDPQLSAVSARCTFEQADRACSKLSGPRDNGPLGMCLLPARRGTRMYACVCVCVIGRVL